MTEDEHDDLMYRAFEAAGAFSQRSDQLEAGWKVIEAAVRAEATLAEREACAKVADAVSQQFTSRHNDIAAAIRARSATHDVEGERG